MCKAMNPKLKTSDEVSFIIDNKMAVYRVFHTTLLSCVPHYSLVYDRGAVDPQYPPACWMPVATLDAMMEECQHLSLGDMDVLPICVFHHHTASK